MSPHPSRHVPLCQATAFPGPVQLLADFSGQFGTKIQLLRKNLVEGILPLEKKLSLSMSAGRVIHWAAQI